MANIILDTWSDTSYISSSMAEALGLKILDYKKVLESTLNSVSDKTYPKSKVVVISPHSNITMDVLVSNNIVSVNKVEGWKRAKELFPNLEFRGLESKDTIQVDLLIGMDFMNLIRGTEILRVGELEARSSLLGYYLEGRLNKKHNEEQNTTLTTKINLEEHPIIPLDEINYNDSPCMFGDALDERIETSIRDFFAQ